MARRGQASPLQVGPNTMAIVHNKCVRCGLSSSRRFGRAPSQGLQQVGTHLHRHVVLKWSSELGHLKTTYPI